MIYLKTLKVLEKIVYCH